MSIDIFQAGFDSHRLQRPRSASIYPDTSAEYKTWTDGWDARQSYLSKEPLINLIYIDTVGEILRGAFSSTTEEQVPLEMMMLLLELGVAAEYKDKPR